MALPPLQSGDLPPGRWVCSPSDVEAAFVHGQDPIRAQIWADWQTLVGVLRQIVGHLPAAWLSGSFVTSKAVPGDLDTVFIVDVADLRRVLATNSRDAKLLQLVASGGAKAQLNLNLDAFVLPWDPKPGSQDDASDDYYRYRGYWDDLWVRRRDPDPRLDSIPRRGFLEVIVDGYR